MPISLPPPDLLDIRYIVLFDGGSDGSGVPDARQANDEVQAWLTMRGSDPLREAVRSFIEKEFVTWTIGQRDELPALPDYYLHQSNLGDSERQTFQDWTHAFLIDAHDLPTEPRAGLWASIAVARALALATDGVILDLECHRLLPEDTATIDLPAAGGLQIQEHILVLTSQQDDGCWITTLGMRRLGLPNLEVRKVPPGMTRAMGSIVNLAAARLLDLLSSHTAATPDEPFVLDDLQLVADDSADTPAAGSTARLGVSFTPEGEMEPFVRLHPPDDAEADPGPWINDCSDALFGTREDRRNVRNVPADSAALEQARQRARSSLPEVRQRFLDGLPDGADLYVKVGFPTGQDNFSEFMWLEVEAWPDPDTLQTRLANDPFYRTDLKAGQAMEIDAGDISDWMISHDDGTREGGFTIAIVQEEGEE